MASELQSQSPYTYSLIVLGGGPAGVTAALRACELGAKVALVERDRMGGTCTNDGCVPTRVLAKAARLVRESHHFEEYGLAGQPLEVDFEGLLAHTQRVVYAMHEKKQLLAHLQAAGARVFADAGGARFVDRHTIALSDGNRLQAEKIIICVGGHARLFPFPGSHLAITHHDVWSMKKLPGSIAIVGGSATGCQVASILAAFGVRVCLLEVAPSMLGREDSAISEAMTVAFLKREIAVITGISGVESIEPVEAGLRLAYGYQGELRSIDAEAVMMAVGWVGNTDDLDLAAAGVKTERSYIVVNDFQQTSTDNIFAAGDITGRMMLVQSGSYEGRIAAENAVLGIGQPYQHKIVPHGGFTDPEYGSVGLTEEQARAEGIDIVTAMVDYENLDRAVIDGHTEGFCKLIVSQENHRILGAHIVGEQALEAIQLVAAGMAADMWVEQLAELELAYPTFTAIVGLAARQAMQDLGVMPLSAQWQALGRPHAAEWEHSSATGE
jgi:pyruvate/2-oxoglutarate dehydrogenase complex dihydrolipoamide dehydrogenase (E3) component